MKKLIIIPLLMLCSCLSACSPSTETVVTQEDYDILLEEFKMLQIENTDLKNELYEQANEYDERIWELLSESMDFEEQAIEAEEKVQYYEKLVKQYNLPTYEESLNQ